MCIYNKTRPSPLPLSHHKERSGRGETLWGFTLLEILIALFIFAIVSMIMVSALHTVLNTQTSIEKNTARFNQLQMAMILISRDVEQTINRTIVNADNTQDPPLLGTATEIKLTRAGYANPSGQMTRSTLQRVHYFIHNNQLIRETWPQLDVTADTKPSQRVILSNVSNIHFEYLDTKGKFQLTWPIQGLSPLPVAVRIIISIKKWGDISQLYLISGQTLEKRA